MRKIILKFIKLFKKKEEYNVDLPKEVIEKIFYENEQ